MEYASDTSLWPLVLYGCAVILLVTGILFISWFLGETHKESATGESYESGIASTGSGRLRFPVDFYVIAMFFVIFDLEAAFIITWSITARETGWAGYWGVFIFIAILLAVLVYEWRTGALDFGPDGRKIINSLKNNNKYRKDEVVDKQGE